MLMEYLTIFHLACGSRSAGIKVQISRKKALAGDMHADRSGLFFCADDGETKTIVGQVVAGMKGFEIRLITIVHAGELAGSVEIDAEIVVGIGYNVAGSVGYADGHERQICTVGQELLPVRLEPDGRWCPGGMNGLGEDG